MNHKTPSFVSPWLAFLSFASVYTGFHFYDRVLFQQDFYFAEKIGFGVLFLYLSYAVRKWTLDDLKTSIIIIVLNIYCAVNIWFAPMHLVAFTFFVIFSCFLPFRRRWLFFSIQALSCVAMMASYTIQNHTGWKISRMGYMDANSMIFVTFLFAWTLRKYVIDVNTQVQEHLHRTSLVGVESSRLLHDLKGLLSSPIMILDGLKSRETDLSKDVLEKHLTSLTEDLFHPTFITQSVPDVLGPGPHRI